MNRRNFLRLLASGVFGSTLDVDRLLWVPGAKKIFIPSTPRIQGVTTAQIVAIEMERILPHVKTLFERDALFYTIIEKKDIERVSSRPMRVPLILNTSGD